MICPDNARAALPQPRRAPWRAREAQHRALGLLPGIELGTWGALSGTQCHDHLFAESCGWYTYLHAHTSMVMRLFTHIYTTYTRSYPQAGRHIRIRLTQQVYIVMYMYLRIRAHVHVHARELQNIRTHSHIHLQIHKHVRQRIKCKHTDMGRHMCIV